VNKNEKKVKSQNPVGLFKMEAHLKHLQIIFYKGRQKDKPSIKKK